MSLERGAELNPNRPVAKDVDDFHRDETAKEPRPDLWRQGQCYADRGHGLDGKDGVDVSLGRVTPHEWVQLMPPRVLLRNGGGLAPIQAQSEQGGERQGVHGGTR